MRVQMRLGVRHSVAPGSFGVALAVAWPRGELVDLVEGEGLIVVPVPTAAHRLQRRR